MSLRGMEGTNKGEETIKLPQPNVPKETKLA
jgi:hypothetical protein